MKKVVKNGSEKICSMVFGSKDEASKIDIALAATGEGSSGVIKVYPTGDAIDSVPLYRAFITN